ncbi:MAG: phage tail protein, partial [Kluyvera sp.]|uniref:phage tail-collar fiber domain-containing protein n=1 Tax=Kluyvera sp. TaxID=1538228 RepID=UPI003A8AD44C
MSNDLVLTAVGAAEIAAAYNAGEVVEITEMQIGDGGGAPVTADPTTEELVNGFGSEPFSVGHNDEYMISGSAVAVAATYPGKVIRELGLMSSKGTLIAYGAYPETWLPGSSDSVMKSVTINFMMPIVHAESVTLVIDPNVAVLTPAIADERYLRQDKLLEEIADQGGAAQAAARGHLALGELATKDSLTARDTGALPLYPTPLAVDLNTLGAAESAGVYCQQMDANALPELNYPIAQSGTLLVTPSAYGCQQEYTTFSTGQKFARGLTTGFDGVSGPWGPWRQYFGDSNAPPYPVTSVNGMTGVVVIPAPDLSGYETIADANARFVTATRFGANMSTTWGSGGGTAPAGCALTGGNFDNDTEYPIYAYLQYCVNGVWINATGGVGSPSHVSANHYQSVPEAGVTQLLNLRPYSRNNPELPGVQHYIDENGFDWFEAAAALRGPVFIAYSPADGVIIQIADPSLPDTDAYSLHPDSVNIAGLDSLPDGCSIDGSWFFDGETVYRDITVILPRLYQRNRQRRDDLLAKCISYATAIQFSAARNTARTGDDDAIQALHRVADELRD